MMQWLYCETKQNLKKTYTCNYYKNRNNSKNSLFRIDQ